MLSFFEMSEMIKPAYTAAVLDEASRTKLITAFAELVDPSWEKICHHMTNRAAGGKPVDSNKLTNWQPLDAPIELHGKVMEVAK